MRRVKLRFQTEIPCESCQQKTPASRSLKTTPTNHLTIDRAQKISGPTDVLTRRSRYAGRGAWVAATSQSGMVKTIPSGEQA
jgi:hypothetical protein